jgi:hypothetical protein
MSIEKPEDLEGMRRAYEVARDTLAATRAAGADSCTVRTCNSSLGTDIEPTLLVTRSAPRVPTA